MNAKIRVKLSNRNNIDELRFPALLRRKPMKYNIARRKYEVTTSELLKETEFNSYRDNSTSLP